MSILHHTFVVRFTLVTVVARVGIYFVVFDGFIRGLEL